jgi:phage tail sheath protein FI
MATDFLHGVETVTVDGGPRPIQTIRSAIIGLVGTAPDAAADAFPLNKPVLVNTRGGFAGIGATGTLPNALAAIFSQFSPFVVVVRVDEGLNAAATLANIVGGVDVGTGARLGIEALKDAQSELGVTPMLLVAPDFTSLRPTGLAQINITNSGAGYAAAPAVGFANGGAAAGKVLPTAHAVLGTGVNAGKVTAVVIDTHGENIDGTLTVTFTGANTTPAAATTVVGKYKNPVAAALETVAGALRAHVILQGPNGTDADAIAYRGDFGSRRVYIVDPKVKVLHGTDIVAADVAPFVAGLIARIDHEIGFWKSPSNEQINNVLGTDRPVDYVLGDPNSRANLLNENEVATIIRDDGFRLWGNRTASSDPIWAFLCVSRTADMIDLSIQQGHRWACDRVINKGYFEEVTASVNAYLRQLQARGAILGGKCWVDPDFNTTADIAAGKVTFSYDFTPPTPAERVTFRSSIVDTYIAQLFAA